MMMESGLSICPEKLFIIAEKVFQQKNKEV